MTAWAALLTVGLASFAMRLSFLVLADQMTIRPAILRSLTSAAPAALAAVTAGAVLSGDPAEMPSRLLAAGAAILVATRTRSVGLIVLSGLLVHTLASSTIG
jgi:branched-subunit amino acid transport protein